MKKYFYIIFFVFITACSSSLIKVKVKLPTTFHPIFGTTSHRSFYYPVNLSDSLKFLWRASSYGGFNNSSVVVYDSLVFIGELSGRVYSFNLNTGKQVGVIKTKGAVYSSPLLTNFRVYFPLVKREKNLTEFIVYDFYSGKEVHIIEIEDRIINQLLYDDNSIYLIAEDGTIYKYTLEMKLVWKTETKHNIRCVPALLDNKIIVGNQFGEIIKLDKISGNILLRKKISSNISSGITYEKEAVYFGDNDGFLFSVDPENLNVNFKVKTSSRIVMNPATDLENVYIGNLKGDFYSISKNLGEIIWAKNFKGSFNTTPIISSNKIILPDAFKAIWFLEKNTGIVIRKLELEGRAKLSPVLIDKKLFIGYDDGILEAYEFQ